MRAMASRAAFTISVVALIGFFNGARAEAQATVQHLPGPSVKIPACINILNGDIRVVRRAADCRRWEIFVELATSGSGGATGPTGATGPKGATGASGGQGATGAQGATGTAGPTGAHGATGATGVAGAAGTTGATGQAGLAGATGANGTPGPAGPTGSQGANGQAGATGPAGAAGATGAQGTAGATGPQGATGHDGATGQDGATGPAGETGETGATGAAGSFIFFSEAQPMSGKPARIELSNGDEDVIFLVNGTAALANGNATAVMASCHLHEEAANGPRNFGDAWVTIPAASTSNDPGMASVAMTGWTVLMGGTLSTVTVECNQPIAAATATGTRSAIFIIQ